MRPVYSFSETVIEAITHDRYQHPDPRVQERMEILWLKSRNEPHGRIAELANVSRSTVQRTLRIYVAKGLDGIRSFGWKGQPSATHERRLKRPLPTSAARLTPPRGGTTGVRRKRRESANS